MLGIELVRGNHSVKAALKEGVVSLLIDGSPERMSLYFFGVDTQKGELGGMAGYRFKSWGEVGNSYLRYC